jgi:DNA-binding Lrp family transcriptional regulator
LSVISIEDSFNSRAQTLRLVNQKTIEDLVRMLSDEYSRKIVQSAMAQARSVEDFSRESRIPLSTCYRRVRDLVNDGILIVEKIVITPDGKKYELFRSVYQAIRVDFADGNLTVDVIVNKVITERLYALRVSKSDA